MYIILLSIITLPICIKIFKLMSVTKCILKILLSTKLITICIHLMFNLFFYNIAQYVIYFEKKIIFLHNSFMMFNNPNTLNFNYINVHNIVCSQII